MDQGATNFKSVPTVATSKTVATTDQIVSKAIGVPASRAVDTVYQAATDGFFIGVINQGPATSAIGMYGWCDAANPPTTLMGACGTSGGYWGPGYLGVPCASFCIPVKSGYYYKATLVVTNGSATYTYWWVPLS
jgi:hypothetical protein